MARQSKILMILIFQLSFFAQMASATKPVTELTEDELKAALAVYPRCALSTDAGDASSIRMVSFIDAPTARKMSFGVPSWHYFAEITDAQNVTRMVHLPITVRLGAPGWGFESQTSSPAQDLRLNIKGTYSMTEALFDPTAKARVSMEIKGLHQRGSVTWTGRCPIRGN